MQDPHLEADDLVIPDFGEILNLKNVMIDNDHGRAAEIAFIKFLVRNVFVLENLHLRYAPADARVGDDTIDSFHRDLQDIRQQVLRLTVLAYELLRCTFHLWCNLL
ncbi:hypothetical protein MKW92_018665 [Papaver armeniacum]|nr:hypothetical protein MKW92_018665 [Papaver armeniacum]